MQKVAYFRFFNGLNDFLRVNQKQTILPYYFYGNPSIKDSIEALGVPHVEIGKIKVDGKSVGFDYKVRDNIQVEVLPGNPSLVLSNPVFVADVHLGKLAKNLRMLGFDTAFDTNNTISSLLELSITENRVILTRSISLLKNNRVKFGYWVRSEDVEAQSVEIVNAFRLQSKVEPFVRCLACNGRINAVSKEDILKQLPPDAILYYNDFFRCTSCRKVYWKGSHYERMVSSIKNILNRVGK